MTTVTGASSGAASAPELLITETLAYHDVRGRDLATDNSGTMDHWSGGTRIGGVS